MSISMEELLEKMKYEKVNLIDIRSNIKYQNSHIPGAINIPSNNLINNPNNYLNKAEEYYLYCSSGHTSSSVVNILNNVGYNTKNILGGYNYYLLIK